MKVKLLKRLREEGKKEYFITKNYENGKISYVLQKHYMDAPVWEFEKLSEALQALKLYRALYIFDEIYYMKYSCKLSF